MNEHNVPILGSQKPKLATSLVSLARHLDETGQFEASAVVNTAQGPVGLPGRSDLVDAEELVEMITASLIGPLRQMIHHEMQAVHEHD